MARTVIAPRLENLALLELNGLTLVVYNSIYGSAFEVLTQNGKNRICHGDNREEVVKKAVEWLEARAVLTGEPVRGTEQTATKAWSDALFDEQKRANILFEKMKLALEEKTCSRSQETPSLRSERMTVLSSSGKTRSRRTICIGR